MPIFPWESGLEMAVRATDQASGNMRESVCGTRFEDGAERWSSPFGTGTPNRRSAGGWPVGCARRVRQRGGWQRCRPPFLCAYSVRGIPLPTSISPPYWHRIACESPHRATIRDTSQIIPDIPVIHRLKTPFSALRDSVSMTALGCGRERSAGNQRHLDQPQATVKARDFLRKIAEWKQMVGAGSGVNEPKRKWRRRDTPRRSR